ncbi:MAG TPA: glycosyltransferase family 9 protein [Flavobacteriales bacterium]|nr:glycosyltransferase family 9 protein [Flavobacteriales bacterium]
MNRSPEHIILSRPDSIGDVMLTLPMAGLLKRDLPGVRITFLGRGYTQPVLACCSHVDHIITLEELEAGDGAGILRALHADALIHVFPHRQVASWARQARIPLRIGTSHRWWHWTSCTHRVSFSRKRSDLHEAQLNLQLLAPLIPVPQLSVDALAALNGFRAPMPSARVASWRRPGTRQVILHPGSRGSAVEWGLDNFAALIRLLNDDAFTTIVTGTAAEADHYRTVLPLHGPNTIDAGGSLSLDELIGLIGASDALVAASTGPLHIAAACGIRAIGLYSPRRPIHPGRWAPIGRDTHALIADPDCLRCAAGKPCDCIARIRPERVMALLRELPLP